MRTDRAQRALYRRCRRGDPEALTTLLYNLGDELYTLSLAAAGDQPPAAELTAAVWRRLVAQLGSWRFGGRLRSRARQIARRMITESCGGQAWRSAWEATQARTREGTLVKLPEALARGLLAELPSQTFGLRQSTAGRQLMKLELVALGLVLLVGAALLGSQLVRRALGAQTPQVRFEALQQLVVRRSMTTTVRDLVAELPDPTGADRPTAQTLDQAGLILEEIANARDLSAIQGLRYVRDRINQQDLNWQLYSLSQEYEGPLHTELTQIALAMEEAASQ